TVSTPPVPAPPPSKPPLQAGMGDYLREAFMFRWNLLLFLGGTAAAAMAPISPVLLPLVAAGELLYLTGLISIPKFRSAIDTKMYTEAGGGMVAAPQSPQAGPSLVTML